MFHPHNASNSLSVLTSLLLLQKSTSRYEDELAWAAVWLYRATKDTYYLGQAEGIYREANFYSPKYFAWDDKRAGVMVSAFFRRIENMDG